MEDEIMETWDKVGNNVEGKTDFLFDGLSWSLDKVSDDNESLLMTLVYNMTSLVMSHYDHYDVITASFS